MSLVKNLKFRHSFVKFAKIDTKGVKLVMSIRRQGFLQALGVTFYCSLIGGLMWKGEDIFGKMDGFAGPVFFLLLFSVSVLISAILVFYNPYKLFIKGKAKAALNVVIATAVWLLVFLLAFVIGLIIF